MSAFTHQPNIELVIARCHECGAFWALESSRRGRCPCCAQRSTDSLLESLSKSERRLNAQKAATSRASKGKR